MNFDQQSADHVFMRRAIELAKKGWGTTHPNPMVGAVIVEEGEVVSEGFHAKDGGWHAERVAIAALGRPPKPNATLYVTLEPCSTVGRTGSCCDLIKATGIRRVVVGASDPNLEHSEKGYQVLRDAGIEVVNGVMGDDCADLNLIFNQWITRQSPLFAGKSAMTLDGKIATRTGDSQWITGDLARADVMNWRRLFPAIAVGANTVIQDNPRLTSRRPAGDWCPLRFVFDGRLRTVVEKNMPALYTDEYHERTIVVTTQHAGQGYVRKLQTAGVTVWTIPSPTTRISITEFRRKCIEEKIPGVLFEGGSHLISEVLLAKELNYLLVYRAPVLLGDEKAKSAWRGIRTEKLAQAVRLRHVRHSRFGDDELLRGFVTYPEKMSIDETIFGLG